MLSGNTVPLYEFFCLNRKYVLLNFLSRNLKLKYRRSVFGYLWTLLIPLAQVLVYYFVYKVILHVNLPNYLSFVVSGILPWIFVVSSINESLDSLVSGHNLLVQAPVPVQLFPAASTVTNFINFVPSILLIFIVAMLDASVVPRLSWLMVVPLSILLFIFVYSLSFLLAFSYVFLRDLKHLIGIVTQLWLYVTPVLFTIEMVPERFRSLVWWNPLSGFFVCFREVIFEGALKNWTAINSFFAWTLCLLLIADRVRSFYGHRVVENI